jgi:hypothetical protein
MAAFVPVLRLRTERAAKVVQPPAMLGDKPELPGSNADILLALLCFNIRAALTLE